ncbi:MAG: ABC-F family ATP-binding cassette domain-containing protein [Clostridia bacterium]|nr:ABC-F family ATP-binding cassette domain-containing protein [Clostridia bacterium]
MALIAASGISKSYSSRMLFEGVSFEIAPRDKVGLVGVNGCGKTTLFRILTGEESPDAGAVMKHREAKLGYMLQNVENTSATLYESAVEAFDGLIRMEEELERISADISKGKGDISALISRQQTLNERYQREGGLTFRSRVRSTLTGLGFTEEELSKPLSDMSGGQRNKAQLAKMLLSGAELLLLDEPTNHLDIKSIAWLEDFLRGYPNAFMVISHDRYFLDRVTNRTLEIKNGRLFSSNGNYSRHIELMSSNNEILRRHYLNQKKEIRRLEGVVEQQRRWGRAHNFITAEAKQKQIERLKAELVEPERDTASIHFRFTARETGGNDVLITENIAKAYDKPVFSGASMHIRKGERVFLLGPNGCGKTTLMKIITGKETADTGSVRLGAKVQPGYYEQTMASLDPKSTALEEIHNSYPNMDLTDVRTALAAFLIRGDDVFKEISTLSGGEKARVQLLKLMLSGANLLLLDEPTNHLDIPSREALENALDEYDGTMLIVTHDRYLVNRLADRVLYMESDGLTEYIGGYDDYLEASERRTKEAPVQEIKAEKPNSYKAQKERQSLINRASGEVRRAEERIAQAEEKLEEINALLASPDISTDYVRSAALAKEAEEQRQIVEELYAAWEQAQQKLDELMAEE